MSAKPSDYTRTVRRPDPRRPESWCHDGVSHDHQACGLGSMWDSSDPRDVEEAVRWTEAQSEPWRFDVPEVPDSVRAFADRDRTVWVLVRPARWAEWDLVRRGTAYAEIVIADLLRYAPLVECEDPRAAS